MICHISYKKHTYIHQELDASSRKSSEMARDWRALCPAVDCGRLMMMIHTYIPLTLYLRRGSRGISDIRPSHPCFTKII
jgi:hypothetical protein